MQLKVILKGALSGLGNFIGWLLEEFKNALTPPVPVPVKVPVRSQNRGRRSKR